MDLSLKKLKFKEEIGRNWFSNRMVHKWNTHNNEVVSAESLENFKMHIRQISGRRRQMEIDTHESTRLHHVQTRWLLGFLQLLLFYYVLCSQLNEEYMKS